MIGGVSKNAAVVKHINKILNTDVIINEYSHIYPAIGSVILNIENNSHTECEISSVKEILSISKGNRTYSNQPLELKISQYPDFSSEENFLFSPQIAQCPPVESDIYIKLKNNSSLSVHLGIDIGSTSTKAVMIDANKDVIAGFYTRTAGRPLEAVQGIFETIDSVFTQHSITLNILSVSTTGSGRKFIGNIIGADLILDEITASGYDYRNRRSGRQVYDSQKRNGYIFGNELCMRRRHRKFYRRTREKTRNFTR